MEQHVGSTTVFLGVIFLFCGVAVIGALLNDNDYFKVPWRVWDWSEHAWAVVGGIVALTGVCCFASGCGVSLPEPTDPVTVEVTACEPALGGTPGQYLQLKIRRTEVGVCEAAMAEESARQAIRNFAERDVDRLGQEFDVYRARGRTDCYCGPVCQEMTKYLLEARQNGLFCRGP